MPRSLLIPACADRCRSGLRMMESKHDGGFGKQG
ncbi:hypothetical protein X566_00840 [Afipia sp. P52-10]|nr:hypothetical protein X566_00840 [Afipia sp. P52-10]